MILQNGQCYQVIRIDEDVDFGCEERTADSKVMAVVTLQARNGEKGIQRFPDEELYQKNITEGDRVCISETGELRKMDESIRKECVKPLLETKFLKVYDLQYEEGRHYYNATRREQEDLLATMSDEEFRQALPDAVSCAVILDIEGEMPRLCLTKEYRYPAGRYLLSVPAGLIDPADAALEQPLYHTAIRELKEETGIDFDPESDEITLVNPMLLSSPGMTDESNAFVRMVLHRSQMPATSQEGAQGSEKFNGVLWMTQEEARKILKRGADADGIYYSVFTWIALMTFVTDLYGADGAARES